MDPVERAYQLKWKMSTSSIWRWHQYVYSRKLYGKMRTYFAQMPTQTKQNPKYFDIVTKEKKKKLLGKNGAIWQIGGAAHAKISNRFVWKTFKFRRPFDKMLVVVRLWFICKMADFINEAQWSPVNWSVCHGNFTRNHFSHGRLQVQIGKKQQHRHNRIWTFIKIYNHTDVKCSLCHSNWMTAKKRKLRGNERPMRTGT